MDKHKNIVQAARIERLTLANGREYKGYLLDPFNEAPPGFIALRAGTIIEGDPVLLTYIKVANIASFELEEGEAAKLWEQFNPLLETIAVKTV